MELTNFVNLFEVDPAGSAKTGLRFFHFIALAVGLGGATPLDLLLLRFFVRREVNSEVSGVFEFATKIVDIGLKVLWITGIGFVVHYVLFAQELLANPKVHAKLVVVAILTVNGMFIHTIILPHVRAQIGKKLFADVSPLRRTVFQCSGAISVVSWYAPVTLGAFSQLSFAVSARTLLTIYFGLILLGMVGMNVVVACFGALDTRATRQDTPRPAPERPSAATLVLSLSNLVGAHRFERIPLAG